MIYPQNRFNFAPNIQRRRKSIGKFLLIFLLVLLGIGAGSWGVRKGMKYFPVSDSSEQKAILSLWNEKNYQEIIRLTDQGLKKKPMDAYLLVFHGFANFYTGVNQASTEDKIDHIDKAIISLRRARLHTKLPLAGEVDYVLGKAYYHKGVYYSDLSVHFMKEAMEENYIGQDTYEYLGLGYTNLSDYTESLKYFLMALEATPTDLLYLTVAQTYYQIGDKKSAEEYLMRGINISRDAAVSQKARFLLGDIYFQNKEYLKAEEQYLKILESNSQNPDAYFYLGEIYSALGDTVKARASWRKTLRIDPNHYGALKRLYK